MYEYAISFFLIACLALARQTYGDILHNLIDSRWNWVVFGFVLSLALRAGYFIEVFLAAMLFFIVFGWLNKNESMFGDGDHEILTWLIPGLLLISNWLSILAFGGILLITFYLIVPRIRRITKTKKNPLVPYIFFAFVISQYFFINFALILPGLFN